jgi:hypothetical protein
MDEGLARRLRSRPLAVTGGEASSAALREQLSGFALGDRVAELRSGRQTIYNFVLQGRYETDRSKPGQYFTYIQTQPGPGVGGATHTIVLGGGVQGWSPCPRGCNFVMDPNWFLSAVGRK